MYFNHLCFSKHKLKVVYLKMLLVILISHFKALKSVKTLQSKHWRTNIISFYPTDIDISAVYSFRITNKLGRIK